MRRRVCRRSTSSSPSPSRLVSMRRSSSATRPSKVIVYLLASIASTSSLQPALGSSSNSEFPTSTISTSRIGSQSSRSYFSDWSHENLHLDVESQTRPHSQQRQQVDRVQRRDTDFSADETKNHPASRLSNGRRLPRHEATIFGREHEFTLFETPPRVDVGDSHVDDDNNDHRSRNNRLRGGVDLNSSSGGDGTGESYFNDDDYGGDDEDDDLMIPIDRYRQASSMRPSFAPSASLSPRRPQQTLSSQFSSSRTAGPSSSSSSSSSSSNSRMSKILGGIMGGDDDFIPRVVQTTRQWWRANVVPNIQSMPKIVVRCQPTTTLKVRKTFRPLKTVIRFGADFNTQLGVWQFKSSWEDEIIGGKLTLVGRELQVSKSWQLSVGAVEDLVTRLRFRAAINLQTFQAYARVGLRTERLTPINVVDGITILKRIPLDGIRQGNVKLEVKANVALPQPEIEYSTETQRRSLMGMGDVEVSIDELNLLLDY